MTSLCSKKSFVPKKTGAQAGTGSELHLFASDPECRSGDRHPRSSTRHPSARLAARCGDTVPAESRCRIPPEVAFHAMIYALRSSQLAACNSPARGSSEAPEVSDPFLLGGTHAPAEVYDRRGWKAWRGRVESGGAGAYTIKRTALELPRRLDRGRFRATDNKRRIRLDNARVRELHRLGLAWAEVRVNGIFPASIDVCRLSLIEAHQ
jgi:hypothetical protein